MKYDNLAKKLALGLAMATTTMASNIDTDNINNNTENLRPDTEFDTICFLAVMVFVGASVGFLCSKGCLRIMDRIFEVPEELQRVTVQNTRREIVNTRDITEVEVQINDYDSDATIVVYAKNIPEETTSRISDITMFRE